MYVNCQQYRIVKKRDKLGLNSLPQDEAQAPKLIRAKAAIQIQALIRKWVFTGALSAGDRINEKHLSVKLGVSRGPIREAIQALRQEGLVEIIPNEEAGTSMVEPGEVVLVDNHFYIQHDAPVQLVDAVPGGSLGGDR